MAQLVGLFIQVDSFQHVQDSFCTHLGNEFVGIGIFQEVVILGERIQQVEVFFLAQQVFFSYFVFKYARLDHHIPFVIDDRVQFFGRNTQQITYFVG
ncbi:hypothetical protein SDC9_174079 [bioreactor metagenome]|uniref:Uncharacterized protein n=1 Tax=bioreactor metagenome TaxID=1076179 RepID=A0A645GRN9_9ZZZZ